MEPEPPFTPFLALLAEIEDPRRAEGKCISYDLT